MVDSPIIRMSSRHLNTLLIMTTATTKPTNLQELCDSGWVSKTVKQEIHDNFLAQLSAGEELFPGIVGYDSTVIPEINLALLSGHDMLFLGEKGQAKSRIMRLLSRFLDEEIPYLDIPNAPVHDDPFHPISKVGKDFCSGKTPRRRFRLPGGIGSSVTRNA